MRRAFAEKRDWNPAALAYRALIRLKRDSVPADEHLGFALRSKGDSEGALAAFWQAVRVKPDNPVARNNLGFAPEEKDEFRAPLEQYRQAAQLKPQDEAVRANLEQVSRLQRPSLLKKWRRDLELPSACPLRSVRKTNSAPAGRREP